jgi:hypothetical protein
MGEKQRTLRAFFHHEAVRVLRYQSFSSYAKKAYRRNSERFIFCRVKNSSCYRAFEQQNFLKGRATLKDFVKSVLAYFVAIFVILGVLFVMTDVEKRLLHAEDLAQATLKVGALALVLWILGIAFVIVIIALVIKK